MTTTPRSTTAAIIMALAFPVGGAALMTGSGDPLERVQYGGLYALAVIALALMYSFIAAAFAYSHGSKPGFPLIALALPFSLPMVLSDLSTRVVVDEVMHSLWHSGMADDVTRSIFTVGEIMGIETTALAFAFGGVAVSALAGLATRQFTRLWEVVALSLLAASLFVWLHLMMKTADDFSAVASAQTDTTERFRIVITEGQHVAALRTLSMWLMLASVVAAGCGVALGKWKRVDVVSAATLIATVGIFVLMSRATENVLRKGIDSRLQRNAPRPPLLHIEGFGNETFGEVFDAVGASHLQTVMDDAYSHLAVVVALTPGLSREQLLTVLQAADTRGLDLVLAGAPEPVDVPRDLAPMHQELAAFLANEPKSVRVWICDRHWPSRHENDVAYAWTGSPEDLAKASWSAYSNGAPRLCVLVPRE